MSCCNKKGNPDPWIDCDPNNCEWEHPFYDETVEVFYAPSPQSSGCIQVCDPSRWAVGQWIELTNGGVYRILSIANGCLNVINTLDGENVIIGNPAPGTPIPVGTKVFSSAKPVLSGSQSTGVNWGDIGGNIINQPDLSLALSQTGSVTSVGLSVPTGLSVSGSPITTSGTLAVTLASGYVIPTTATLNSKLENITGLVTNGSNISITGTGTNGDPYVINASGLSSGTVTSVGLSVPTGLSVSGSPITTSGTLAITLASGYVIPTSTELADKLEDITGLISNGSNVTITGTGTSGDPYVINSTAGGSGTVTSVGLSVPTGLSVSGSPITTSGTLAITLSSGYTIPTTSALAAKLENITGLISNGSNITITGSGTSGSPYVISASGGGSGTVTSVGLSVPTGLTVSGSPITSSGTLAISLSSGYVIPTSSELADKLEDITGLVTDGTGITVTGSGTSGDPYVISYSGGSYTLPTATGSTLGGVKLGSGTTQSVASNAVSSTAGRTYAIQLNSSDQMVVNVPWTDTNTTYTGSTSIILTSGAFQRAALTGDVTASQNSNATTIANDVVTNAKLANMASGTIKARYTNSTGDPQDATVGNGIELTAGGQLRLKDPVVFVDDSTTFGWDFAVEGTEAHLDLVGNTTVSNPTNTIAGQSGNLTIQQDNTGGKTVTFGSMWLFPDGIAPTLNTDANKIDLISFTVRTIGGNNYLICSHLKTYET